MYNAGVGEGGIGRVDRFGSEADKQLVHKSKEEALETIGGHAVHGDGWLASTECSSPLYGWPLHRRWSLPARSLIIILSNIHVNLDSVFLPDYLFM